MKLPLLKAINGVLAHTEKKCPVPYLHVDFGKKKRTAQLSGPFRGERVGEMLKSRNHYDFDTVFPYAATFVDRSLGLMKKSDLTRMSLLHTEIRMGCFSITKAAREWKVRY